MRRNPARFAPIRSTCKRYIKFCLVGGSGVAVDMAVICILASPFALGLNLTVSKVIAAEAAIGNNFLWNDLWTFRGLETVQSGWRARFKRFLTFNLLCLVGLGISVLLLNLQVCVLHLNMYLANGIAIVLVSIWNFAMNLRFGWSQPVPGSSRLAEPRLSWKRHLPFTGGNRGN